MFLGCSCLRSVVALIFSAMTASAAKSTLKVAVCVPGKAPYATLDAYGELAGFDIGALEH